jgi:FMN phosphatase YigB (HAD superfamily)
MNKFRVSPETCLFVDDLIENVRGAEACGIQSVHYTDAETTICRVSQILGLGD